MLATLSGVGNASLTLALFLDDVEIGKNVVTATNETPYACATGIAVCDSDKIMNIKGKSTTAYGGRILSLSILKLKE